MKRTFYELRRLILRELASGQQTINQISTGTGINWRTVSAHLDFLTQSGDVVEVVSSEYVRIFRLANHDKLIPFSPKKKPSHEAQLTVKISEDVVEIK